MSAARNYNAMSADAEKTNEVDKPSATSGDQESTANSTKTNGTQNKLQVEGEEDGGSSISGVGKPTSGKNRDNDSELYTANQKRVGRWGQSGSQGSPGEPNSRGQSPMDNYSDLSQRPKSRQDVLSGMPYPSSRYNVSSFWKARRVLFYRNGDPFFPAVEFRFKPGRDISTLDKLLDKISSRMDLPRGARYIFSIDGDRKFTLDEIEDGGSYVVSSFKVFKVSATNIFSFCQTKTQEKNIILLK